MANYEDENTKLTDIFNLVAAIMLLVMTFILDAYVFLWGFESSVKNFLFLDAIAITIFAIIILCRAVSFVKGTKNKEDKYKNNHILKEC